MSSTIEVQDDLFEGHLRNDLHTLAGLATAATVGFAESWCAPFAPNRILSGFKTELQSNPVSLYRFVHQASEALGYTAGIAHHVEGILKNPEDWKSYIPIATNLVGRSLGYAYDNYFSNKDTSVKNAVFGKVTKQF